MMCAVQEVRSYVPQKIVLVTPVSSSDAAIHLCPLVDEFISLYLPLNMVSIGQFYRDFPQVQDKQVIEILHGRERLSEYRPL